MQLPPNLTTITVTGTFNDQGENLGTGTVTFAAEGMLTDAGYAILSSSAVVTIAGGVISVALPCTDNADLAPTPFMYNITVALGGQAGVTYTGISIPHTLGATVDLTALI